MVSETKLYGFINIIWMWEQRADNGLFWSITWKKAAADAVDALLTVFASWLFVSLTVTDIWQTWSRLINVLEGINTS